MGFGGGEEAEDGPPADEDGEGERSDETDRQVFSSLRNCSVSGNSMLNCAPRPKVSHEISIADQDRALSHPFVDPALLLTTSSPSDSAMLACRSRPSRYRRPSSDRARDRARGGVAGSIVAGECKMGHP